MEWLKDLLEFLWAVITNWAALTTGGVIVALLALWSLLRQQPIRKSLGIGAALFFLFLAFFNAWREQKHAAVDAKNELERISKPNFAIRIGQAVIALNGSSTTVFIPFVEIVNKGADSVVTNYRVHYKSDSFDGDLKVSAFLDEELKLPSGSGSLTLHKADFLTNRITAISRGHMEVGRLLVLIPGVKNAEINSGKALITLYIKDYLGDSYSAVYQGGGPDDLIRFGPGETGTSK
jgi:hypothetical protein